MAIQTGIFKTPTGGVYNPAQQIERGFDKTAGIVTDFLGRKAQDFDQQQAAFGQMYSNLGELEAKLQENYAGINQQMIDSTREWLKESMKSGKRATDPEFQMGLSQRVGRIRAGMANADRNRELLKQAGEMIKSDPSILDKAQAMGALYSRMNDPDFLISKNEFQVDEFLDDYVNPTIIAQNVAGMLKSTGTFSDKITDPSGKLVEETVNLNEAIDVTSPLVRNPDGTTKLNIKPSDQLVNSLVSGDFGSQAARFITKMATQNYGGVNPDTLKKAAADFLGRGMGPNYMRRTLKTAEELETERLGREKTMANINLTNENIKLANAKMQKELAALAKSEKEQTEMNNRWDQFLSAYDDGTSSFFGDFMNVNPNLTGFKWETDNSELQNAVSSRDNWSSLTRDERLAVIEKVGVSNQVPSSLFGIGPMETDTDEAYKAVKSVVDQMPSQRTGVSYLQKTGTKDGEAVYQPVTIQIDPTNMDDLVKAFKALENIRISGKNYRPVAEPTATTGATTTPGFKSVPQGGF